MAAPIPRRVGTCYVLPGIKTGNGYIPRPHAPLSRTQMTPLHTRLSRTRKLFLSASLAAIAVLASSSLLSAHDFFLVPGALAFAPGTDLEILAQSSSRFPTSVGAIAVVRVARAVMIGEEGETVLTQFSERETSLVLRARPASEGQRLIAVDLVPRSARQTPADFIRWLKLEGAPAVAERLAHDASLQGLDSITRTDTKHAKTIVDIGRGGGRSYSRSSGQMIEFVPLQDPAALRRGDTLRARLVFKGAPAVGVAVHAAVPAPEDTTLKGEPDVHLVSDANGIVAVPIRKTGLWLIRAIHVLEGARGSWETHWASLVFKAGE